MKRYKAIPVLILLCAAVGFGQDKPSGTPAEWSLHLKTGGAPWTKQFEVELEQTGKLILTEHNPERAPNSQASKLNVTLSAKDARQIYEQALKAFREFRFEEEEVRRHDGTNLTLRLKAYERVLVMQFFHLGQAAEECPEVAAVLSLINRHLPPGQQVY